MSLRARATAYLRDAGRGIRRAPVEVLATLVVAFTFSAAIEIGGDAFGTWLETAVACALIITVAWSGTLLHATGVWDETQRRAVTLAGAALVTTYALTIQDFTYEAEGWRALLLVGGAVAWLIALPAFGGGREDRVERMRRVDARVLLRVVGAVLYGGALFAGLALALRAVDVLFELSLEEEIYGHVFGWIFFALVPLIVLGGLADFVRPASEPNAIAGVAQRIVLYLVPPLLALYYVILFAYVARIFVTGEVPKNLVSPLVLAAGGLSALGLLLFDPQPNERGAIRWLRYTAPLFLPVAGLGFWALLQRTDQYGLTEFRVTRFAVLVLLDALALAATLWLVRRRRFPLHVVPVALAVLALLLAIGPFSALSLSRRSQSVRLRDSLVAVGISPLDTAYVAPPDSARREVPTVHYEQIRGSAQFLAGHYGPDALPPLLRARGERDDARYAEYPAVLGLMPDSVPEPDFVRRGGYLEQAVAVPLDGGTAWRVSWPGMNPHDRQSGGPAPAPQATMTVDGARVVLVLDGRYAYADLSGLLADPPVMTDRRSGGPGGLAPDRAALPLVDADGRRLGDLVLLNFWLRSDTSAAIVSGVEGIAIVRAAAR